MIAFIGLLGILLFFVGLVYLLVSFYKGNGKAKNATIVIISGIALFFIAYSFSPSPDTEQASTNEQSSSTKKKSNKKSSEVKVYKTTITSIKEDDNHDWVIKGTTKAPNGAKIGVINPNSDCQGQRKNVGLWQSKM